MSIERYADTLAAYLPNDRLFASKFVRGSNLRGLIRGAAYTLRGADESIAEFKSEYPPHVTNKLIEEWEALVGIPDRCFTTTGSIEDRRRNVIIKLVLSAVQTLEDFQRLMDAFGTTVIVQNGTQAVENPLADPPITFATDKERRFTIVLGIVASEQSGFPYTFPILFGSTLANLIKCVARRVAPANVQLICQFLPSPHLLTEDGTALLAESGDNLTTEGIPQ